MRASRVAALIVLAVGLAAAPRARAEIDRIAELTQTLSSSSEKERLAATAALAKLGDRRTMKPLVTALVDPSAQIRALAATALGKLGHKSALPALKSAATDDVDERVRTAAHDAAITVARANGLPAPWQEATAPRVSTTKPRRPSRPGFGNQPRALDPEPDVYVLVNTAADDSPGKLDKGARKVHGDILRQTLLDECKANPVITTTAAEAKRLGLDPRNIDLSVTKMEVATVGSFVEIDAQLRLAISDANGKMLSFLSGGAKVQVPKHKFDARYLPNLRREALENAMRGMFDKLLAHLRDRTTT
jgi:hypothetical protein